MTWGFASYETRFRWAAAVWAVLMTVWCMSPLSWEVRLIGAAVWIAITVIVSLRIAWWRPRSERDVPIFLAFHAVSDTVQDAAHPECTIHPEALERLICNLKSAGYRLQTVEEAIAAPDRKSVVLTFDGGTRDAFFTLFPILKRTHAKATCFLPEHDPEVADTLRVLEIQEMARSGLVAFGGMCAETQEGEAALGERLTRAKRWLTGVLGKQPIAFALPEGEHTETVRKAALTAGYPYLFICGKEMRPIADAPHAIHRRPIPGNRRPLQIYLLATRGRYRIGSALKQTH